MYVVQHKYKKKLTLHKITKYIKTNYKNINDTLVINPTIIVLNTLKNAVRISSTLLTTSKLIFKNLNNNNYKI